jgi:ribonuclease BN (tRNA processing enzyme)
LLVNQAVLIDAGTGVGDLSLDEMSRISEVFLTHSHLDHVCGLAFMADNLFGLIEHPLHVHATPETLATLREHLFNWRLWPDFTQLPDAQHPSVVFHPLPTAISRMASGLRFTAFEVTHTVPAVGYAVEGAEGVFAFSGDTTAGPCLWQFLNTLPRLDKLMIDVAFADEDAALGGISKHFTPSLLASELAGLRHRPRLYLTHHKPGTEQDIVRECRQALAAWDYVHLKTGDLITL